MIVDILWIFLSVVLMLIGFAGCILPVLPGPILCFAGLMVAQLTDWVNPSTSTLTILGVITVLVLILDNIVPIWGTKKFGGTSAGLWGSGIGLAVAVIVLPLLGIVLGPFGLFGVILGPLVGAYVGEKIGGTEDHVAVKAAFGSFVGFLAGTFLKAVISVLIFGVLIADLFQAELPGN